MDGLIVCGDIDTSDLRKITGQLPIVELNTNRRDILFAITFADEEAAGLAAQAFFERHSRRPALLLPSGRHYSTMVRRQCFVKSATALGLASPVVFDPGPTPADTAVGRFLTAHPRVDSILLYSEILAGSLYRVAPKFGRVIGQDLLVMTFNEADVCRTLSPTLSALAPDYAAAGRFAVERMQSAIRNPGAELAAMVLPYRLIVRPSLGSKP